MVYFIILVLGFSVAGFFAFRKVSDHHRDVKAAAVLIILSMTMIALMLAYLVQTYLVPYLVGYA